MIVSILLKRIAEFLDGESASREVKVFDKCSGREFSVLSAEEVNDHGEVVLGIEIFLPFHIEMGENKGG